MSTPAEPLSPFRPSRRPSGDPALDAILDQLREADVALRQPLAERQAVYTGRYMTMERDSALTPEGHRLQRDILVHPGAVVIAPLDADGSLILVVQYRVPVGAALLELPAGTLDVHDGVVEDEVAAAHRELEEETGYRAASMERLAGRGRGPSADSTSARACHGGGSGRADRGRQDARGPVAAVGGSTAALREPGEAGVPDLAWGGVSG